MYIACDGSERCSDFRRVLTHPLSESGSLWIPETLPTEVPWPERDAPLHRFATEAVHAVTGERIDFSAALGGFDVGIEKDGDLVVLDLTRGPTLSFKDVGCSSAAAIYKHLGLKKRGLVATSGDTGSAAAEAFSSAGLPITVLFPIDRVSGFQVKQMVEAKGATVLGVGGDFDACQKYVKHALRGGDDEFLSCNSVSLARLLPQIAYYAKLAANVPGVTVVIPSGNMGNATAAQMAKRMGCNIARVHIACNENDAVARCILKLDETYTPKPTVKTPATAMDVGDASNWPRLAYLDDGDYGATVVTTEEIEDCYYNNMFAVCPHTCVSLVAADKLSSAEEKCCVVMTASARKFLPHSSVPYVPVALKPERVLRSFRNAVLIGLPGVGKSTLAQACGGVDTDAILVEKHGSSLSSLVENRGVDAFLDLESAVVRDTIASTPGVIATGGSAVYRLQPMPGTLIVLLTGSTCVDDQRDESWSARGIVSKQDCNSMQELYAERSPYFQGLADMELDPRRCDAVRILHNILR